MYTELERIRNQNDKFKDEIADHVTDNKNCLLKITRLDEGNLNVKSKSNYISRTCRAP